MRLTYHPKLSSFSKDQRLYNAHLVTGRYNKSDWSEKDKHIIQKICSKHTDKDRYIKTAILKDLYSNHRKVWTNG
jgi:hypothetical protein